MRLEKQVQTVGAVMLILMVCVLFRQTILLPLILHGQVIDAGTNVGRNGFWPSDAGKSWSAYGSKTDTSNLQIQAAPGALQSVYIYEAFCTNVHASTAGVALIKYSTTTVASVQCTPGVTGHNAPTFFDPPLKIPANTAVTMNSPASITTLHFFAAGTVAR